MLRRHSASGFTLIEMLMAMAMGTAIILIATAGVRAASQTVTTVVRLSYQNHLLREGFLAACNEIDFWLQIDNPGYPDQQLARSLSKNGTGQAFTPFTNSWPEGKVASAYNGAPVERLTGWSSSPMAWAPFDPRTWLRVNSAERAQPNTNGAWCSDSRYGDYSLFEGLDPEHPPSPTTPYKPERCRSWYANQVKGVIDSLGFYGLYEYLPSHVLWAYHGINPKGAPAIVSRGGMATALTANGGWLACSDGPHNFARGRYRSTRNASVPLPNPDEDVVKTYMTAAGSGRSNSTDPFRTYWLTGEGIDGYGGDRNALIERYMQCTKFDEALMQIRPAEWPEMVIEVHHYVKNARMVNVCMLNIFDPMTGSRTSLPFTCSGTTLRGARQQRMIGLSNGGWATYNNSNPQQVVLGPTLDWPKTRSISW